MLKRGEGQTAKAACGHQGQGHRQAAPKGPALGVQGASLGPDTCLLEVRPCRGQSGRWGGLGGRAGVRRDRYESCLAPEAPTPWPQAFFRARRGRGPRGAPRAAES